MTPIWLSVYCFAKVRTLPLNTMFKELITYNKTSVKNVPFGPRVCLIVTPNPHFIKVWPKCLKQPTRKLKNIGTVASFDTNCVLIFRVLRALRYLFWWVVAVRFSLQGHRQGQLISYHTLTVYPSVFYPDFRTTQKSVSSITAVTSVRANTNLVNLSGTCQFKGK